MAENREAVAAEAVQTPYATLTTTQKQRRLRELAWVFLKLGTIAFGGPAAHIAMMDDEVVKQRQWMSRDRLLDMLGITNLIPVPTPRNWRFILGTIARVGRA